MVRANALREHAKKHAQAILAERFKSLVVLLLCAALLVGSAYLPVLSTVLELEPLGASGWVVILVLALFPLLADDGREP